MSTYTTNTSDKSKATAIKRLLCGGIGLHLFYVGRIKAGIIRAAISIIACYVSILSGIFAGNEEPSTRAAMIVIGVLLLVVINLPDFIKLKLGTFRDNVGNVLRE